MNLRIVVVALILAVGVLGVLAWQHNTRQAKPQEVAGGAPPGMPPTEEPAADPGVTWQAPSKWATQPAGGMRAATYDISGPSGDAQCVVYYFGPGQGGSVEANMERWMGEFHSASSPQRADKTINGIRVHRIKIEGDYSAHGMGMGGQEPEEKGAALLGAIAEGPNGSLFFKLTGPAKTVEASEKDFDAMLASLAKS